MHSGEVRAGHARGQFLCLRKVIRDAAELHLLPRGRFDAQPVAAVRVTLKKSVLMPRFDPPLLLPGKNRD